MKVRRLIFLLFLFLLIDQHPIGAQVATINNFCMDEQEFRLARHINNFRSNQGLPSIPLSRSLSYVAKLHVYDLQLNRHDTSICNAHSWSNKGKWTACCYNNYVPKNECMWDKPKELTPYIYRGYELVFSEEGIIDADSAFELLRTTPEAANMILSRNDHSDKNWLAMGVGINENYVSIWFGQRKDAMEPPSGCNEKSLNQESSMVVSNKAGKYHLIYGSFINKSDAAEAIKRYKNSGFPQAGILQKDGKFRVSIEQFTSLSEAMKAKERLHDRYPEAWIYKE